LNPLQDHSVICYRILSGSTPGSFWDLLPDHSEIRSCIILARSAERRLADNIPTIATVLHKNNYQTAGFVNNSQVGELVGFQKGHDLFEEVWKGISYKSIIDRFIRGGARKIKSKFGFKPTLYFINSIIKNQNFIS